MKAQRYMQEHLFATKSALAAHLGGRRADTLDEILEWERQGLLHFAPRRKADPLASLKAESLTEGDGGPFFIQ
jgi:hypothetical protein